MAMRRQHLQMAQALARHANKEPHAYSTPDPVRSTACRTL
jgi:hypothetical protein